MMDDFIWLLFAHYIGDFALQTEWMAANKRYHWYVMYAHCMVWTGCVCIALQFLGIYVFWKVAFLMLGHYLMDMWKCTKCNKKYAWWYLVPDQAFHIIQLLIVYYI